MSHSLSFFFFFFFQSNEYESPTGDLRYGHAFDSRCAKHSPAVSPNASSPVLSELDRTPDCGCQVRILSWYSYIISYNHACFLFLAWLVCNWNSHLMICLFPLSFFQSPKLVAQREFISALIAVGKRLTSLPTKELKSEFV